MLLNDIIRYLIAGGAILGGMDYLLGNRLQLGKEFEKGVFVLGALFLHMAGVIFWAPVIAGTLTPYLTPFWQFFGIDPSVTASMFAIDMGGYHMAMALAKTESAGIYTGVILSSMLGGTLVFSIPIGLNMISRDDMPLFAKGLTAGFATLPVGAFLGGCIAGFPIRELALNTLPVLGFSVAMVFLITFRPGITVQIVARFALFIKWLAITGLVIKATEEFTGIILVQGMAPFTETFDLLGTIALFLIGAFPLLKLLTLTLSRVLSAAGILLRINRFSVAGLMTSVVSNIPMFNIFRDMDRRGKVINCAFMVSGAFVIGGQLAVTYKLEPQYILPFISAKLIAGVLSIPVAIWLVRARGL